MVYIYFETLINTTTLCAMTWKNCGLSHGVVMDRAASVVRDTSGRYIRSEGQWQIGWLEVTFLTVRVYNTTFKNRHTF
jgi:hypothetical protein